MLPLIGLAASFVPDIIRLIGGDKTNALAGTVNDVVTRVTGATDADAARAKLADPAVVSQLQIELAKVALEAQKAQNDAAAQQRQAELDQLKATLADTSNARGTMTTLAASGSLLSWGAAIVSAIVAIGFFAILALVIWGRGSITPDNQAIVYTLVGTMATAFATMISFWLGSSQGSRDKDETVRQLGITHASAISSLIDKVQSGSGETTTTLVSPAPLPPPPGPAIAPPDAAPDVAAPSSPPIGNFPACFNEVLELEGGMSDDPRDPGGMTNLGITRAELADFRRVPVSSISEAQMRALTRDDVEPIYRTRYWNVMSCDGLEKGVDMMVFHFGVNAGDGASAKLLQGLVGVAKDGGIGPITLAAANKSDPLSLVNRLADAQLAEYRTFANFDRFGQGWINRVNKAKMAAKAMLA